MKTVAKVSLLILAGLIFFHFLTSRQREVIEPGPEMAIPPAYQGLSTGLKATEIAATLETPITKGKNLIWCASFPTAWKVLQEELAGEPVALEGKPELARRLNEAGDLRPFIPAEDLYAAAGWNQQGIINQIRQDLKRKFPDKEPPTFPGIAPDSFVAYAYLEANVKFPIPYSQNHKPLLFTNGSGTVAMINSFGIPDEDSDAYLKLRKQPCILFFKSEGRDTREFAMDLCSNSSPNQIVVARIDPETNLLATLEWVEKEVEGTDAEPSDESPYYVEHKRSIGPSDTLLIPDLDWFVSHHFAELEGRSFANQKLKGQRLDVAQEDIRFHLGKSGAELRSEAKENYMAIPHRFVINQPFLIYMKQRSARTPCFVMWVDNAELLSPWMNPKTQVPAGN
jgi:hypothetical protein